MITKFVLNAIFYHVGMSWIICFNNKMLCEIEGNDYPNQFNKGTWYNTSICSKFQGKVFEYFIKHARIYRYNIMCSIIEHDKQKNLYEDY